jgi:hypothetical protein
MPTIQTAPNKGGQTIQTVPNKKTTSTKTKTLTKTLPDLSTITEIIVETAEIPAEPVISSQSENNVKLWFSENNKTIIGISFGFLFLMIFAAVFFQIRRKKARRREEDWVIVSPKTPKTPETPRGIRERKRIKDEISRRTESFSNYRGGEH